MKLLEKNDDLPQEKSAQETPVITFFSCCSKSHNLLDQLYF